MNQKNTNYFIDQLQSQGRYSFAREEILVKNGQSIHALRRALERLQQKGRVVLVSRGFYVIIPLEYRESGILPAEWFIHDLMNHLDLSYYVGLLSAAAFHGAAHQRLQQFQVLSQKQLRPIFLKGLTLRFFLKKNLYLSSGIVKIKTETGFLRASSPELTALDLVKYPKPSGGLGNISTVLSELGEKISGNELLVFARREKRFVYIQRLGYLLDHLGYASRTEALASWLSKQKLHPVLLDPSQRKGEFLFNKKWRLFENQTIEAEIL